MNAPNLIPAGWQAGGLYSTEDEGGQFGIVKVLVVDAGAVHVRVYKQKLCSRPASVDPSMLTLGKLSDKDGFSAGHLPLSWRTFAKWKPILVSQQPVYESELEGYRLWQEANGGIFDL